MLMLLYNVWIYDHCLANSINFSIYSSLSTRVPSLVITISSIFLLPDSTTSSRALTTNFNPSSLLRLSLQYFSRNSLTCLELRPQDWAFHSEKEPDGSVQQRCGRAEVSKPARRQLMPKGRTPPFCVYFCLVSAMNLEMYSTGGLSSQLSRQLWHSILALLARILPSAVRPEQAICM